MGMAAKDYQESKGNGRFRKGHGDRFLLPPIAAEPTIAFKGKALRSFFDDNKLFLARFLAPGKESV